MDQHLDQKCYHELREPERCKIILISINYRRDLDRVGKGVRS